MRIGLLSQWFDPEPGPASLPAVYGREFANQGHEVKALTGFPNYPSGSLYDGYRLRPRRRDDRDGMTVTRVPLVPSHSSSAVGRMLNYGSFSAAAATLGAGALRGVDGLWVYNSPATVTLPMLTHSRWGRTPVFLHVQDLWPDSLVHSGMMPTGRLGRIAERTIAAVVRIAERRAAVIGVISPSVRDLILERDPGLDPQRIVYAPNPTNESLFRPVSETRTELGVTRHDDVVEVMYAGAVGEVQGLDTVLDAARLLGDRRDIRIAVVGDGIRLAALRDRVETESITNVRLVGRVDQAQIPALIARAQIQLVSLADSEFLRYTTPSKISALLASGVPIVAQLAGDGAALIEQSGAGIAVAPGDAQQLASAIVDMVDEGPDGWRRRGQHGREFYESTLAAASTARLITGSLLRASTGDPT